MRRWEKGWARLVTLGDARQHLEEPRLLAGREDSLEKPAAKAASARVLIDIDRYLGRPGVGAAVRIRRQGRPADDLSPLFGDDHGVRGAVMREPIALLLDGLRLGVEGSGGEQDRLVVDLGDRGEVRLSRWAQRGHG